MHRLLLDVYFPFPSEDGINMLHKLTIEHNVLIYTQHSTPVGSIHYISADLGGGSETQKGTM